MAPRKPKLPPRLELLSVELRGFYRIYASAFPDPFRQGNFSLPYDELEARSVAEVGTRAPLRLVDLSGETPIRMGVPSDVGKRENHNSGMRWSLALHEHPEKPDGILYRSRLDDGFRNVAVYGRSVGRLTCERVVALSEHPELPAILHRYGVGLE
jgi:hypothetical protein